MFIRTLCIIVLNFNRFLSLKKSPFSFTINFECRINSICQLSNFTYSFNSCSNASLQLDSVVLFAWAVQIIVAPMIILRNNTFNISLETQRRYILYSSIGIFLICFIYLLRYSINKQVLFNVIV